ncbi:Protein YTP1 [Candida maltosa Xu316]|uniref:Protein YTP1 n=1 Tax=Candida maltosa (strain Xu316) TaxID=1245528 RepID=M3K3C5_CANMX|nr:Protein YTP1 [Candida maltosa Xu316]
MSYKSIGLVFLLSIVKADMDMDMDEERPEFHPINAGSKSFHWILTLFILLILPSISTSLAMANRVHWSVFIQYICTAYSVVESLFLDFPDNVDNHENRTSKGTSWFLSILLGVTVFIGTLISGSNLVINRFYPHLSKQYNEYGLSYKLYKVLSFLVVLTGWVRVCMAPIALFGFCYGKHTGQCIAHGIMGSAFILYSFILSTVLVVPWIRKHQLQSTDSSKLQSQEFYDSTVMMIWGIVNTFTEHRWGREGWNMGDYQHTAMGIIWWGGGLLGMYLSRNNRRSFVPSLLLIFTGYSMSQHAQHLAISTNVHALFGIALMGAGAARIVEISFLLKDKACDPSGLILSFQYLPPFCLTLAGILFMGATEEQLQLVHDLGSDHSAYILVVSSAAFLIFLWIQLVLWYYLRLIGYDENGNLNDKLYQSIDPEEFELGELSEDDEHIETPSDEISRD